MCGERKEVLKAHKFPNNANTKLFCTLLSATKPATEAAEPSCRDSSKAGLKDHCEHKCYKASECHASTFVSHYECDVVLIAALTLQSLRIAATGFQDRLQALNILTARR